MDNDKHSDIITLNSDQDHFTVHFYNPETLSYEPSSPVAVDTGSNSASIVSVVIAHELSPLQSLYVVYYKNPSSNHNPTLKVFRQKSRGIFEENRNSQVNDLEIFQNS